MISKFHVCSHLDQCFNVLAIKLTNEREKKKIVYIVYWDMVPFDPIDQRSIFFIIHNIYICSMLQERSGQIEVAISESFVNRKNGSSKVRISSCFE